MSATVIQKVFSVQNGAATAADHGLPHNGKIPKIHSADVLGINETGVLFFDVMYNYCITCEGSFKRDCSEEI